MSLLDAAAFDVKESHELDFQIQECEKDRYKGGTGPSLTEGIAKQNQEEKQLAEKDTNQIFQFSSPSEEEQGPPMITDESTHRADKTKSSNVKGSKNKGQGHDTKYQNQKNQAILKNMKKAQKEENLIKVKSFKDTESGRKFEIWGSQQCLQKEPYIVDISMSPACSCPDYMKNASKPCKHFLWLYLFVFRLQHQSSDILQQTSLTAEDVAGLLTTCDVEKKFRATEKA